MGNSAEQRTLTVDDLMAVDRIAKPAVSPDGRWVVFTSTRIDLENNRSRTTLRLLDLTTDEERELTPGPGDHSQPAWAPDSSKLCFVSNRDDGGQLWILRLDGGEAHRVTSGGGGVSSPVWAGDNQRIAFSRSVLRSPYADETTAEERKPTNAQVYGLSHPASTARVADRLLFRHWDAWRECRRSHLFVVDSCSEDIRDLTPFDCDVPPISLGSARDWDFSPRGDAIAYAMNPDEDIARSTNNCIFLQRLDELEPVGEPMCISESEACDSHPRFGADGTSVFYLGMEQPGYEASKNVLKVYDLANESTRVCLGSFDRSPGSFVEWRPGTLLFNADDRGRVTLYSLDVSTDEVRQLTAGTFNSAYQAIDDETLLVSRETTTEPADFFVIHPGDGFEPVLALGPIEASEPYEARQLTHAREALEPVEMNPATEFWYPGAEGRLVHGYLVRPPNFDPRERYPLILLVHGGPQGAFADQFHYRWNAQLFASRGAVVAFPNFHGSTGYGQPFTDQIGRDWGGACYQDNLLCVDHLLETCEYLDPERIGAAGASFGGYMVNWFLGHTDRFRALVSHDGIFNLEAMAYTTEELWFPIRDLGGLPHELRDDYERFSPHRFAGNFQTPTLVVQGEQDFRCPVSEGLGLFTALQTRGVESRYLHFPDEGHWVMQPANAVVWYREVMDWLMTHLEA